MVGKGVQCRASTSNIGQAWSHELMCFTIGISTWDLSEAKWLRRGDFEAGEGTTEWL